MTTKLEAIRAREDAATPGEWVSVGRSVRVSGTTGGNAWHGAICNTIGGGYESRKADRVNVQARDNADFIANSRADIPLLRAVAEAAVDIVGAMTVIEHPHSPTDYAQGKVTNEQWRALVAAIAPLMEAE